MIGQFSLWIGQRTPKYKIRAKVGEYNHFFILKLLIGQFSLWIGERTPKYKIRLKVEIKVQNRFQNNYKYTIESGDQNYFL